MLRHYYDSKHTGDLRLRGETAKEVVGCSGLASETWGTLFPNSEDVEKLARGYERSTDYSGLAGDSTYAGDTWYCFKIL